MEKILHRVKANLYDNVLTEDANDFVARVVSERTLDVSQICKTAVSRGGASISAESMEHGVNLFLKEMGYQLCDGYSVNTGYFTANALIKGVFNSPAETYNPDKHSVIFQFNQGEILRKELPTIQVDIQGIADSSIGVAQVTDIKTGSVNELLTPGRNLRIKGYKLKLAGENAAVGVSFIHQATGQRTRVDATDVVTNNPSELVIVIPALPAGLYQLEITSQYAGGALLKEPRTAVFDKMLTVK